MSGYALKEIFYTLQGEGIQMGRPSVFCRFAGCNLWSGREDERESALCAFCDTEFVGTDGPGGGRFGTAKDLAAAVAAAWLGERGPGTRPYAVCTGGEPLLQLDEDLLQALHAEGFEVGVETNGTRPVPPSVDWVCVSPKANAPLVQTSGDELKLVYPQVGQTPEQLEHLEFRHFLLSPMDGPNRWENTQAAIAYCLRNPRWRLSIQMHKIVGIR